MLYADIIVDISAENLDKTYQYSIPEKLTEVVEAGVPVTIPFGKGNRTISGYVVGISEKPKIAPERIKPIVSIREKSNSIDSRMIALAWWMKEQYGSTMNDALHTVIPVSKKIRENVSRIIVPAVSGEELKALLGEAIRKKHVAKQRFLEEIIFSGSLDYDLTVKKLNISAATIKKFEQSGTVKIKSLQVYRNPFEAIDRSGYKKPVLNEDQEEIAQSIISDINNDIRQDYLLHGITGSGKTEIYMEIIDDVIAKGKQVIMLIPEISLTYQTVKRFYMRYGDRISIINSKLSGGERYDQYLRIKRGEADICIGPRSALFAPFENLGLIIMDEEHEGSYVSEKSPRYSAREVAFRRARMENASVILGSATPSLEAYSMARGGRLKLFSIMKRANNAVLPSVHVVDMREELKKKNRSIFSVELQQLISDRLSKHEQIMLFLNRRGYSGMISCRSCGNVIKCPHCDISLTVHNNSTMVCHYCGYTEPLATVCPSCGSKYIGSFGIGTQKVEEQIKLSFPSARVLRLDADTTKNKNSYEEILSAFANEEADILVGTQMIVKGHDFGKCTLVGILIADMSLYSPDFRAGERTFQLLTQASGRAGRGSLKGDVVIQTYNPEHYCIRTASKADYADFYEEEMSYRRIMDYPPARCMMTVLLESKDEQNLIKRSQEIADSVNEHFKETQGIRRIIGPLNAPLYKAEDFFRRIITVKSNDYGLLTEIMEYVRSFGFGTENKDERMDFIFN